MKCTICDKEMHPWKKKYCSNKCSDVVHKARAKRTKYLKSLGVPTSAPIYDTITK